MQPTEIIEYRPEAEEVIDDPDIEDFAGPVRYAVTCYGADPDVEGLVKRLGREEIIIPDFQRQYVWKIKEASRFVESLLLGLPVPGIFMAKEQGTNKMLVIDGQQRLKTLEFFYKGHFNPRPNESRQKVFRLTGVDESFEGKTFETLSEKDRLQLNDSIIHATIVKQDTPADDDTSIYHIFARLNSGGQKLKPQEIRVAAYHGPVIRLLKKLNAIDDWRKIFGKPSHRLKDEELILRFLALYNNSSKYESPMGEFINKFAAAHRALSNPRSAEWENIFRTLIETIFAAIGNRAFRPERTINAAVFDAVTVGLAHRLSRGPVTSKVNLSSAYDALLKDNDFQSATSSGTAQEANVALRIRRATDAFATIK